VVITCKRTTLKDLEQTDLSILSPENSINQLNINNYSSEDREVLQTINDYMSLRKIISLKKAPESVIMSIAFRIYHFIERMDNNLDNQGRYDDHKSLQLVLKNAKKLIIEEEF
jgi:hypothetical protein